MVKKKVKQKPGPKPKVKCECTEDSRLESIEGSIHNNMGQGARNSQNIHDLEYKTKKVHNVLLGIGCWLIGIFGTFLALINWTGFAYTGLLTDYPSRFTTDLFIVITTLFGIALSFAPTLLSIILWENKRMR